MSRMSVRVGQMPQLAGPIPAASSGAFHPAVAPEMSPKRPVSSSRARAYRARSPLCCKTCKGQGCVGKCRF